MPPPTRSTRSSGNAVLQSLPKKSRKTRGQSSIATSTKQTRAHSESSAARLDNGEEGQAYERAYEETIRRNGVSTSRSGIEVQVTVRNKRDPIPVAERGRPITVVSARKQDELRRLSAGKSIIGASMGKIVDGHTNKHRKSLPKKSTTTPRTKSPKRRGGRATSTAGETQEVITLATPALTRPQLRPRSRLTRWNPASLPSSSSAAAEPTKPNPGSPGASTPTPSEGKSRNDRLHEKEVEVEKEMSGYLRNAFIGENRLDEELLTEQEETQHGQRGQSETRVNRISSPRERESSDGIAANDADSGDGGEDDPAGLIDHSHRTPPNSLYVDDEEDTLVFEDESEDPSDQDMEEDEDLIQCLAQIKKSKKKFGAARSRLLELLGYFTEIKALQNDDTVGWYNIIGTVTTSIINNSQLPGKNSTFGYLDDIMESLTSFHTDTKSFESILRRLMRNNFTQRANIEKGRKAIKKAFKKRRYQSKFNSEETDTDREIEAEIQRAREAMKKKNEEIERALRRRERELFGCRTPDSSEDLTQTRKRKRIASRDDRARRQKQIRSAEAEEQEEGELHPTPQQYGYYTEEGDGWREEEEEEEEEEGVEEKEADEEADEEATVENDDDDEEEREEGEGEGEEEGDENHPIVIGDDDIVEVVTVEAFGEHRTKTRAKAMVVQRSSEELDGGVEVLEDREWEDKETKALLDGIEQYKGNFRFDQIKSFFGDGNDAPLRYRSIDAIKEKAIEIKKELEESGHANLMGPAWDDI